MIDRSLSLSILPLHTPPIWGGVTLMLAMESPWTQTGMRMSRGILIQPTFPQKTPYRAAMRDILMSS